MPFTLKLDLKKIIIAISLLNVAIVLLVVLYATRQNEKIVLTQNTIDYSLAYSKKIGAVIEDYVTHMRADLKYSANVLSKNFGNPDTVNQEAHRSFYQSESFNSVLVVDSKGIVKEAYPSERANLKNTLINSPGAQEALREKKSIISKPYISVTGNLIISVSEPIFSPEGEYLGYINGAIYLKHKNMFSHLLDEHFYNEESMITTLDADGSVIQSTQNNSIGQRWSQPKVLNLIAQHQTTGFEVEDTSGEVLISSLYYIDSLGWSILIQTPASATINKLNELLQQFFIKTAPFAVLSILIIYISSNLIPKPLWQLANLTKVMSPQSANHIQRINAWYFEAAQLKQAVIKGFKSTNQHIRTLNQDAMTDYLTGLLNRRGMEHAVEGLRSSAQGFSVIAIDIDHFKRVNDTYGHDMGDQVLQQVAQKMKAASRNLDILCRQGGEEFLILSPKTDAHGASLLAERLRQHIQNSILLDNKAVTVSTGVAEYHPKTTENLEDVFLHADQALYQAKTLGRNRTVVYPFS